MALPPSIKLNTKSVRFRTTVGAVLALVVLLAIAGLVINVVVARQIDRSADATLIEQANDRAALLTEGAPVESLMSAVGDEAIVVAVGPAGEILASFGTTTPGDVVALPPGVQDVETTVVERGESSHRETLRTATAITDQGFRIVVGNEGESTRSTKAAVRSVLFLIIPSVAVVAAAVAWFVTGRALEPVKAMRRDLEGVVDASDGRRVVRPDTGDEVDELGGAINDVLDRLDQASLARRRFVADASHELKSPLANARSIIETAEVKADPAEHERVTTAVRVELNRLHALVDDLLYLAREDEAAPRSPRRLDLADLVFDEAERTAAMSPKTIDASGVIPVQVFGDPADVSRAIRNLVENAERFATERVTLSVLEGTETATLIVGDDGPGIAAEHRESVFERFRRLETDRARSAGGTGLGLAIVASIAARNGGAVSVSDSSGGGARFELVLPTDHPDRRDVLQ